jgi:nucleotide-binding universal stress UspA family protein
MPDLVGLDSAVVATDFSRGAAAALHRAAMLPFRAKAHVSLIHVLPARFDRATDSLVRDVAQQRLDAAVALLQEQFADRVRTDIRVTSRLIRGDASSAIGRLAEQAEADLVVLGRHGAPVLRELLLGSVAQRVSRHARVPVLVVAKAPRSPYRQIVAGFDLSPDAVRAVELATRLATPDAQFEVVYAYREVHAGATDPGAVRRITAAELSEIREEILQALPPARDKGAEWSVRMERGDPRKVLLEVAESRSADLIAMGSIGRTGLQRRLIGSVAEGVLQVAKVDVLITPRPLGKSKE